LSARSERALTALESGVLAAYGGGFGVFPGGDRRRRPLVRLTKEETRALEADGAVVHDAARGGYLLTPAGRARSRRAREDEPGFLAQHAPIGPLRIVHEDGVRIVKRVGDDPFARLERLKDLNGKPWFSRSEIAAARRLREDWEAGHAGLLRGSDWSAPPRGSAPRGPGGAQEAALSSAIDARGRVEQALDSLAPPMRRAVERTCLHETGLATLEREECWPEASAKVALKCALAQLAAQR